MYDETACTAIRCHDMPTMALVLRISYPNSLDGFIDEVPYCDEHIGWFYRSFSRKSYENTEVLGIKILIDADAEFGVDE